MAGHHLLHTQRGEESNFSFGGKAMEVLAQVGKMDQEKGGFRAC